MHYEMQVLLHGECTLEASRLSFSIARALSSETQRDARTNKLCEDVLQNAPLMLRAALELTLISSNRSRQDNYVYLLTTLRFAVPNKHVANMIILPYCESLMRVFSETFAVDPDGYTAPELTSMWSTMVHDQGAELCSMYLPGIATAMAPVVRSHSVASVVGCILLANLSSKDPAILPLLYAHASHVLGLLFPALAAAFTGMFYLERQWGPGPICRALASLSASDQFAPLIYERISFECLCQILLRDRSRWQIASFDDDYYDNAKASAARILTNLASHLTPAQCTACVIHLKKLTSSNKPDKVRHTAAMACMALSAAAALGGCSSIGTSVGDLSDEVQRMSMGRPINEPRHTSPN